MVSRASVCVWMLVGAMGIGPTIGQAEDEKAKLEDSASHAMSDVKSTAEKGARRVAGGAEETAHGVERHLSSTARTLSELHTGNRAEVRAGQWMKDHARSDEVKSFANKMVEDHSNMDQELTRFAEKNQIALSIVPKADEAQSKRLSEIQKQQGSHADRAYMRMMVEDHVKDVKEARTAEAKAKKENQTELAALLDGAATKIQGHLDEARQIRSNLMRQAKSTPSASGTGSGIKGGHDEEDGGI